MKRYIMLFIFLVIGSTCFSGCNSVRYTGIRGEMYVAPLSSILSHPVTASEVPDFYERRRMNAEPHRRHYRSKDRKWSAKYRLKGRTR